MKSFKQYLEMTGNVHGDLWDLISRTNDLRTALQNFGNKYPEFENESNELEKKALEIVRSLTTTRNTI